MNREVRWQPRKWVSLLLRVLVFVIPLILGVAAAFLASQALGDESITGAFEE